MDKISELQELAKEIRKDILKMTYEKKAAFIGTSFSCADILAALFGYVMNYDKTNMESENNDVFFLSKGHGASALYATLANVGLIEKDRLYKEFNESGYRMGVHGKRNSFPGIISSSGSLGQGVGLGTGYALASKMKKIQNHTYVLVGDGESNEGSNWEAFMFAKKCKLDNFTVILDRNKLQSYGHDEDVLNMGDMKSRFESFGFFTIEVDGHDMEALVKAFETIKTVKDKPTAIIANTVKGKGFSGFEDNVLWHYKWPEDEHYKLALEEIEGK